MKKLNLIIGFTMAAMSVGSLFAQSQEYLMLGKSMFNDEGQNVFPSGGATISYPVYLDFNDASGNVTVRHLFRNFLENEELPLTMTWNPASKQISVSTPQEFYDKDECPKLGEEDDMIISLLAGNPYGIGYWEPADELEMNVSSDGNVIIPGSGFAMVGNTYDDVFECWYYTSFYDALFDTRLYRRSEGVAIYADRETLDFGDAFISTSTTRTFRVVNAGTEKADFVVSSKNREFKPAVTSGYIAPGEYVDIEVSFMPTAAGEYTGTLFVDTEESSASITLTGACMENYDFSPIVSAGQEYLTFATGNEYPFVIKDDLATTPVAVSTNGGEGRTSSWLEVGVEIPEGKKGVFDWKGFFNPRWSVYDSFSLTNNDKTVYTTPSDDQYVMEIGSVVELTPGYHTLRFSYDKGSMVTPIDVELGEDYAYISDINFTLKEFKEYDATLSAGSYDFGNLYLPEGQMGRVVRENVVMLYNGGSKSLTVEEVSGDEHFEIELAKNSLRPQESIGVTLTALCRDYGKMEGNVTIRTQAGELTLHCMADVLPQPDYNEIVKDGDFAFEVGRYPFVVVDGHAVNDPDIPADQEIISEFTAHFNVPAGKKGLLTWNGSYDCGDGNMGMIMIDQDAYGMAQYEGMGDAGNYSLRPYQCWLDDGDHMISFGYMQSGTSEWAGANTFSISDLSLTIHDEYPALVVWEKLPLEFKPLYPGKSDNRSVKVYNFTEETMALLDVTAPDQFTPRFNTEVNSQVPQFVAAGFTLSFTPTEIGEHSGNALVKTSVGDIEIPVTGVCLDPSRIIFEDDFEDGLEGWTVIDDDGDGKSWTEGGPMYAYTGENCVLFSTFLTRLDSQDYLVSPEFTIPEGGATITYRRTYTTSGCIHDYDVRVGTGDDPKTFTTLYVDKGMSIYDGYDLIEIPVNDFDGKTVRMCFGNFTSASDTNVIVIDDVVVLANNDSGLRNIEDTEIAAREVYTLSGIRADKPGKGVYIVRDVMKDGTVRVRKVNLK